MREDCVKKERRKREEEDRAANVTQSRVYQRKSLTHTPPSHSLVSPTLFSLPSNLSCPSLHFIASSFLTISFLTLCPPFKVGLTLGVLNLQPHLCLSLSALTVNLCEKWRRWHIAWHDKFPLSSGAVNQTPYSSPFEDILNIPVTWAGGWLRLQFD